MFSDVTGGLQRFLGPLKQEKVTYIFLLKLYCLIYF